jgi:environmental stress-induced protein Ves
MAWKNGGGSTTELWVDPPGADLSTFDRRLSIAAVRESGPFSAYLGIDRTIALLGGTGMVLDFGVQGEVRLDRLWNPVAFSGDEPAEGRLLGGPCRDFNVMTRRGRWRHRVAIVDFMEGGRDQEAVSLPAAHTLAVFVLAGAARIDGFRLATEEMVLRQEATPVSAGREMPGTALLCASFFPW